MTRRPAAALGALVLAAGGLTLLDVPVVARAEGDDGTVFIDDSLQTATLSDAWVVQGARWTPAPRTVAQNNAVEHTSDTTGCSGSGATCPAVYDPDHDGRWLTLTSDNTQGGAGEAGFVLHDVPFSSRRGVVIEYDQRVYRTNDGKLGDLRQGGGDGLALFLADADAPTYGRDDVDTDPTHPGGYGAALGYSSVADSGDAWCHAQPGLAGAYLGIGFDVYGNFQKAEREVGPGNPATRPLAVSGASPFARESRLPQSIGLRGSGVRITGADACDPADERSLERAYGMVRVPLTTAPGHLSVFQVRWDGGDDPSTYAWEYRRSVDASWTTVPTGLVAGGTVDGLTDGRGYVVARVPVDDAYTGSYEVRYRRTVGGDQDARTITVDRDASTGTWPDASITGMTTYAALTQRQGGYRWLAGTSTHGDTTTGAWIDNVKDDAREYRRVRVTLTPTADGAREVVVAWSDKLSVTDDVCVDVATKQPNGLVGAACDGTAGEWRAAQAPALTEQFRYDLARSDLQAAMPARFSLGFAASTGWAVNYHQVRNLRVTSPTDLAVDKTVALGAATGGTTWADTVTGQAGDTVSYRLVATNEGPSPLDPAHPATLTDALSDVPLADPQAVTWTATATGGAAVRAAGSTTWSTTLTGTGPLAGDGALEWHAPDRTTTPGAAVTVVVTGELSPTAGAGTYPNTATVAAAPSGGPQESDLANNTDDAGLVLLDGGAWGVRKTASPASGATVTAGTEIGYTVTATAADAAGRGDVRGVVLTDDLSDVLDDATFVAGSARLTIGTATPVAVADPEGTTLTTQPFDLARGTTATLTYRVRVDDDVEGGTTLRNVVVGDATSGGPATCAPPADPDDPTCSTTHTTPAVVHHDLQVEKRGEDTTGTVVPMDGSRWAVYADAALTEVVVDPVPAVAGATGLARARLEPGTYWLVETRALPGFGLLPTAVELTLAPDGAVTLASPGDLVTVRDDTADADAWTVVVQDVPALALPETGGRRPVALVATGLLLTSLACAAGLSARRARTGRA